MTGRERLLRTFRREAVDRVPVAPFLYYNAIYEMAGYVPPVFGYYDPPDFDPIVGFVSYCDRFGFDVLHVLGSVWDAYAHSTLSDMSILESFENWDVHYTDKGEGDEWQRTIKISTPGGTLCQRESYRRSSTYLVVQSIDEHLIKSVRDFDIFRAYAPPADRMNVALIRRAREAVGDQGLVNTCILGVFNLLTEFRNPEQVFYGPTHGRRLLPCHDELLSRTATRTGPCDGVGGRRGV